MKTKEYRTLLSLIMSQWLPLATTTFQTVVEIIPPPQIAQSIRVPKMLHPEAYATATTLLPTNKLERDLYSCDPTPEAGIVCYISKMFAVKRSELPENRVKLETAEDMREKARIERERRAAEKERERQLDAEGLIGLGADGKIGGQRAVDGVPIPASQASASAAAEGGDAAPSLSFVSVGQPSLATPAVASAESDAALSSEALMGFARLYSGTLNVGTTLYCLLPKYNNALPPSHPANAKFITKVEIERLYMMMGRDLVAVETVPAGNVFAIGGLEGKVWRNATLCSTSGGGVSGKETDEELQASFVNLAGVIMAVRVPLVVPFSLLSSS